TLLVQAAGRDSFQMNIRRLRRGRTVVGSSSLPGLGHSAPRSFHHYSRRFPRPHRRRFVGGGSSFGVETHRPWYHGGKPCPVLLIALRKANLLRLFGRTRVARVSATFACV